MSAGKIGVVITTYNEAENIGSVLRAVWKTFAFGPEVEIYVVDAASTDGTPDKALLHGACVMRLETREGIGPALMRGWRKALADGCALVGQMDAGGSHGAADLARCLNWAAVWAAEHPATLVIGSRFEPGEGGYSGRLWRRSASWAMGWLCDRIAGERLHDWTSGLRAFSAPALEKLLRYEYQAQMHGWQIEALNCALQSGVHVVSAPIRYQAGRSSFSRRAAMEAIRAMRGVWEDYHGLCCEEMADSRGLLQGFNQKSIRDVLAEAGDWREEKTHDRTDP